MDDKKRLRILLVQIRKDEYMIPAERQGFVKYSGLKEHQFTTLDVFRNPDFPVKIIDDFDMLMIGGLSDDQSDSLELPESFSPFLGNLNNLMLRAINRKVPSLLSCGGFMLASMLLGARVVIDPDQAELEVVDISLTSFAKKDPLFRGFPSIFKAVSGHIKSTIDLPDNCIHLAFSERCQIHGFKVSGSPFYAFQFHPEINCEDLKARVRAYKDKYFQSENAYFDFISMSYDTTITNSIMKRFVELFEIDISSQ